MLNNTVPSRLFPLKLFSLQSKKLTLNLVYSTVLFALTEDRYLPKPENVWNFIFPCTIKGERLTINCS